MGDREELSQSNNLRESRIQVKKGLTCTEGWEGQSQGGSHSEKKGWTCTEARGKEPGRSYVTEPISVKLQVKKGWACTEGWRDIAR